ncbi:MAG: UvrB/UvrC motif-containing protein [Candidatus Brocadiia bacterium]
MGVDLGPLFGEWPHDRSDETKNVRCVRGNDGKLKIQVRVRCGIFQWEYDGRPDGDQPHNYPTLLDYYRDRINQLRADGSPDASLHLGKEQVDEISEELMDYYQRRVLFFRLGEYGRARRDAEHNLGLLDVIRQHTDDADLILEHEKWRPFVLMDRSRAQALLVCQRGQFMDAIHTLNEGIEEIADFFRRHGREDLVEMSQEIATLKDLKHRLRELYDIPLSRTEVVDALREEQAKAIADEDYERAARLRDEIARHEEGDSEASA